MKRILSVVLLGVLMSPAFFSGAMAAEIRRKRRIARRSVGGGR